MTLSLVATAISLLWLSGLTQTLTTPQPVQLHSTSTLQVAKQWKLLTYNFEPQAPTNDQNFFNPTNVLVTGVAVSEDRIFIATPKLFSGVPSTVSVVSKAEFGDSPPLQAYPDWSYSTTGRTNFNCSDLILISVYRLRIDSCNRLWILDAGVSRSLEDYQVTCPPKILVVDLNTDRVVRRIDFPREVLRGESLFTNLVIDETTAKSCDDVFVYITDTVEPGIIVYDSGKDITWRLSHPAMYPDPDFAQSEILNDRFVLMDGVVGLTFDDKSGIVYFQPLATDRTFSVHKNVLRAGPLPLNKLLDVKLVGKKSSQGIGLAISPYDSSLIFAPMSETAIAQWNPATNQQSVLNYDRDRLQFIADITTTRSEPGVIYAVSSKFHRFFLKNLNTQEINNRIVRIELPQPTSTHLRLLPEQNNLISYGLKPLTSTAPLLSSLYAHTTSSALQNYFTNSATVPTMLTTKPQPPYKFDQTGVVNYGIRNPFTALNQGEAFPPSKASREIYQRSFLDSLIDSTAPTAPQITYTAPTATASNGYYYQRGRRHATELKKTNENITQEQK